MSLFAGATRSRAVADRFVTSLAHPEVIWAAMCSPEGAERFLTSVA